MTGTVILFIFLYIYIYVYFFFFRELKKIVIAVLNSTGAFLKIAGNQKRLISTPDLIVFLLSKYILLGT